GRLPCAKAEDVLIANLAGKEAKDTDAGVVVERGRMEPAATGLVTEAREGGDVLIDGRLARGGALRGGGGFDPGVERDLIRRADDERVDGNAELLRERGGTGR